jgi:hypothetical protein
LAEGSIAMVDDFTIVDLVEADVPTALPLLRATWPELDLPTWQDFASIFCSNRAVKAKITCLHDAHGGLCGLFASRVEHGLCEGRFLAIPLFTAVDIGNSLRPVQLLLDAASAQAKESGCADIQIRLASEQSELVKRLRFLGLYHAGTSYAYPVGLPSRRN